MERRRKECKLVDEKKKERRWYLFAGVLTLLLVATIPLSVWRDKHRQQLYDTVGGCVGIVNETGHHVDVSLYGHDGGGVVVRRYAVEPGGEVIVQDSMSKAEVTAFPPEGFVDSAMLVFDDSVVVWHKGTYPWDAGYEKHCIHHNVHWQYESVVVRNWTPRGSGAIYRPTRRYTLTEGDYTHSPAL